MLEGVTDVRVTDFSLDGGHGITGTGSGRLFPTLNTASDPLMGSAEFTNTSAVSQRNGRVYHYVFSDGVSAPSITFRITAQESGAAEDDHDYTLEFGQPLSPAAWYKVNATIRGFTGAHTITIFGDNTRQP